MDTRFEALGAYLPSTKVSTRDLIREMKFEPLFDLQELTGIETRRVHDKRKTSFEDSFTLAMLAAKDCLQRSRYRARDLDVIISASITRYKGGNYTLHFEPSFALHLKRGLGAYSAIHFDVSNAGAGMMTGVQLLDRMIRAGIVRNGMVVSGECITPITDTAIREIKQPFDSQFGSLTVGDSGAAVILDRAESDADKIHYVELMTCAEHSKLCIGMPSVESSGPALYTNHAEMNKEEILQLWPHFQRDFLEKRGSTFAAEKYDYIVHHQVGTKAIRTFSRYASSIFGTELPQSLVSIEEYGNTASTSHFIVLYDHLKEQKVKRGAKFLLVPAASGLVTGCLAATITSLEVA